MKPPVSYQGGKARLAKQIVDILDYKKGGTFCDLCCGSGAISLELVSRGVDPHEIIMIDCSPWGAVWEAVGRGAFCLEQFSKIISSVPRDPADIKQWVKAQCSGSSPESETVPYWFLIFQSASFGGKPIYIGEDGSWKTAGWRDYWLPTATSNRRSPVNPMMPMPSTLLHRMESICEAMKGVRGRHCRVEDTVIVENALVYIDPPYRALTGYGGDLDAVAFAQRLPNKCWVSEASALPGGVGTLISRGRAKGGVSGLRKSSNEEWLTKYDAEVRFSDAITQINPRLGEG